MQKICIFAKQKNTKKRLFYLNYKHKMSFFATTLWRNFLKKNQQKITEANNQLAEGSFVENAFDKILKKTTIIEEWTSNKVLAKALNQAKKEFENRKQAAEKIKELFKK